jgi:hypothetical protein
MSNQWRLKFADTDYPWAYEVEMRGSSGGSDQCSGGTPTSGGNFNNTPAEAFDNNLSTYHITYNQFSTGVWLAYQFSLPVGVTEVAISMNGTIGAPYTPSAITLEYYNGTAWVAVRTWSGLTWTTNPETKVLTV